MKSKLNGPLSHTFAGPSSDSTQTSKQKKRCKPDYVDTRFKFSSNASRSKRLKPNLLNTLTSSELHTLDQDDKGDHQSHFYAALQTAAVENLSIPFSQLFKSIEPLSRSLPLLIYHKEQIVKECCLALVVQDSQLSEWNEGEHSKDKFKLSKRAQRNQVSETEKQRSSRLRKARERVNLVAGTVLKIFVSLVIDLSTSLLEVKDSLPGSQKSPFEELLTTLIYFINLPDVDAKALEDSSALIFHLFKTLSKDLAQPGAEEFRVVEMIWNSVRVALGAPFKEILSADILKASDEVESETANGYDGNDGEDGDTSDDDSAAQSQEEFDEERKTLGKGKAKEIASDIEELEDVFARQEAVNEANHDNKIAETTIDLLIDGDSTQSNDRKLSLDHVLRSTLRTTTPTIRKLLAGAVSLLVRKREISDKLLRLMLEDLKSVEANEIKQNGSLRPRKHKEQADFGRKKQRNMPGEERGSARVFAEGICWTISESCKSPDSRLHSKAGDIFIHIDSAIENMINSASVTNNNSCTLPLSVLKSALIAILHHSNAENSVGVLAAIIDKASQRISAHNHPPDMPIAETKSWGLEVSLVSLTTLAGLRQGSRIIIDHKKKLFQILLIFFQRISQGALTSPRLLSISISYALNLFCSINSTSEFLSISEIRKSIKLFFSKEDSKIPVEKKYQLGYLLYQTQWLHFNEFILPELFLIADHQFSHSTLETSQAASLFAGLAPTGLPKLTTSLLDTFTLQIKKSIKKIIYHLRLFTSLDQKSIQAKGSVVQPMCLCECYDWISVYTHLSIKLDPSDYENFEEWIGRIKSLERDDAIKSSFLIDYKSGEIFNKTFLLAKVLELAACESFSLKMLNHVPFILKNWGWNQNILLAVNKIIREASSRQIDSEVLPFSQLYQNLQEAVLSENDKTRQLALSILHTNSNQSDKALHSVIELCLKIEETPPSVECARHRLMYIRKLGIMVKCCDTIGNSPDIVELSQRILLAQLKVNFKPLWEESIKYLTETAERYPESFWKLVWDQLVLVLHESIETHYFPRKQMEYPTSMEDVSPLDQKFSDCSELLCTNLEKLRSLCSLSLNYHSLQKASNEQVSESRLDLLSYHNLLLNLLCSNSVIAQKHNRLVIEFFFTFCQADDSDLRLGHVLGRVARTRITHWLPLIARFTNPKSLYRSEDLRKTVYDLLADPDPNIQKLSLDCVLNWNEGSITRQKENLYDLLEPSKFRDTLLKLSLSDGTSIARNDRREVMPVIIRLLYGCILTNRGRSSSNGKGARKFAIISSLKGCTPAELDLLVDLMLHPFRRTFDAKDSSTMPEIKKQIGFIVLLGGVLKYLGRTIIHRWSDLLNVLIEIVTKTCCKNDDLCSPKDDLKDVRPEVQFKRLRNQSTLRLNDFFHHSPPEFNFQPWIGAVFGVLIIPRLPSFAAESSQSASPLLQLFHTWSSRSEMISYLVEYAPNLLNSLFSILGITSVKPVVITRVLEILENILKHIEFEKGESAEKYLKPYLKIILPNFAELLRKSMASFSLTSSISCQQIKLLFALAPFATQAENAEKFCELILPTLLTKNQVILTDQTQADLILLLSNFLKNAPIVAKHPSTVSKISKLFGTVSSRKGRCALIKVIEAVALHSDGTIDSSIIETLDDLNSFSTKRMDEPDFGRRLKAFGDLNEVRYPNLNITEWELLVQHAMFQIQDPEELSLRSSSSLLLRRFLEETQKAKRPEKLAMLTKVIIPYLKKLLRSKLEIVRQEVLTVLSAAAEKDIPEVSDLKEMSCLLVEGDKEANFFLNVYHIQVHRRTRALSRLADEAEAGRLSSKVLIEYFFPLLVHTLSPSKSEKVDLETANVAIRTLGRMAKVFSWPAYYTVLQFYLRLLRKTETTNKTTVRALVSVLKSFHFNIKNSPEATNELTSAPHSASSFVSATLIPTLTRFIDKHEEGGPDDSLRIMLADSVAFVATFFSESSSQLAITGIISSLSNILKSTLQDTRQAAKAAVASIAALLGPNYLKLIFKELRAVLTRGPYAHVLAHVAYTIMNKIYELESYYVPPDAVGPIMEIIIDDLFGQPSRDRQSKELRAKTKFNETKTSRSLETFQMLISRLSNSENITEVLTFFRNQLETKHSERVLRQIGECFHRICAGILENKKHFDAFTDLKLVHTLILSESDFLKVKTPGKKPQPFAPTDHRLVLSTKSKDLNDYYAANAHMFVGLGLNLFNTVYRRGGFNLHQPEYLRLIDPLVKLVGNTLYSRNSEVLAAGMKVMGILIKLPLPEIEKSANVIVRQMLAIVSRIGSSESELSQVALKTLGSVIRDCKKVELSEKQLTGLLNLIAPDLEDPERQMTLFALLRGIMSKKFLAPELYDLMDNIARFLVTAQSSHVQEICRSVYLQFLLDYPQGKGRLSNSLEFLIKNLSYEHESGRKSVLEILNALIMKFGAALVSKHSDLFFMSLVMSIANETSEKCKEMAIEVLKVLLKRIEAEKSAKYMKTLLKWCESRDRSQPGLMCTAVQLIGVYTEARGPESLEDMLEVHLCLCSIVKDMADELSKVENEIKEDTVGSLNWQVTYQALQSLSKIYKITPSLVVSSETSTDFVEWLAIQRLLLFPHAWVRNSAARLVGTLLSADVDETLLPFRTENLMIIARNSSLQLRSKNLDESLALQIVKNLYFVLKTLRSRLNKDQNLPSCRNSSNGKFSRALNVIKNDSGRQDDSSTESNDSSEDVPEGNSVGVMFIGLIKKLSRQACIAHGKRPSLYSSESLKWSIEPASVLRCFAALIKLLSVEDLSEILKTLLVPIFRIVEDSNTKDPQMNELQNLAKEVQEFLTEKVGTTLFSQVYGQLRTSAMQKRQDRKKTSALKAINQPELVAKRKLSRAESKRRFKKRKQEVFSRERIKREK
ncbi:hypothetical protein BY996DRAFT_4584890 [Phakopsora pachyrhizi]|nr:hypothetical protein BY996DRAFT_4584890 [Phakopsora pachyrhizi]